MSDVFLSYSSEDRGRAQQMAGALEECGLSVWWDRKALPGETFSRIIERELDDASCVVVLWSTASVLSEWVEIEAARAKRRGVLVPALLDDVAGAIPIEFSRMQAASLVSWKGEVGSREFDNLLLAIRHHVRGGPPASVRAEAGQVHQERAPAKASDGLSSVRNHLWLSLAGIWVVEVATAWASLIAHEIREFNLFDRRGNELRTFTGALLALWLILALHGAFLGWRSGRRHDGFAAAFGWLAAPGCLLIYLYHYLFVSGQYTDGPEFPWPYYAHFKESSIYIGMWLVPCSLLAFVTLRKLYQKKTGNKI